MIIIVGSLTIYFSHRYGYFVLDYMALIYSIVASSIMGIVLYGTSFIIGGYLRQVVSLIFLIPLGIIIYLLSLRMLKAFNMDDLIFVQGIFPQRWKSLTGIIAKVIGVKLEKEHQ